MLKEYTFCKSWPSGHLMMTARGNSLHRLYGPWEAEISGAAEDPILRYELAVRLRITTVRTGEGTVHGVFELIGKESGLSPLPVKFDLALGGAVQGTSVVTGTEEEAPRLTLALSFRKTEARMHGRFFALPGMTLDLPLPFDGGEQTLTFDLERHRA